MHRARLAFASVSVTNITTLYAGVAIAKDTLQLSPWRRLREPAQRCQGQDRILREFYQRLHAAGKMPVVTLTAAMRKLIALLNRMLKNPHFHPITSEAIHPKSQA